jgi:hypothetical protein
MLFSVVSASYLTDLIVNAFFVLVISWLPSLRKLCCPHKKRMTEFRKVSDLVEELRAVSAELSQGFSRASAHATESDAAAVIRMNTAGTRTVALVTALAPRLAKLVAKAEEQDPNKMVYNELMCERILALSRVFTEEIVLPLCSLGHLAETAEGDGRHETEVDLATRVASCAAVQWAQDAHDEMIVRLAATDSWRGQLLNTLEALVQREEHVRTVLQAEQRAASSRLFAVEEPEGRRAVREAERRRSAARWAAETARRSREADAVAAAAQADMRDIVGKLRGDGHLEPMSHLVARLGDLIQELAVNPDNIGIRTLRCANTNFVSNFGHEALTQTRADPLCEDSSCEPCCCGRMHQCAIAVLYAAGYVPEYSSGGPVRAVLALQGLMPSSEVLPCGTELSLHVYSDVGYELYGERMLKLQEPNPMVDPDAWCAWRARLEAIGELLSMEAKKRPRT